MKGPFIRSRLTNGDADYWRQVSYQSDSAPYQAPLPYEVHKAFVRNAFGSNVVGIPAASGCDAFYLTNGAINASLESELMTAVQKCVVTRLRGADASIGVALAEAPEAIQLLVGAAGRLKQAWSGVRRGDVRDVAEAFDISYRRARRRLDMSKDMSDRWLAFHFGVAPLYGDIYDSVKLITSTPAVEKKSCSRNFFRPLPGNRPPSYGWFTEGHVNFSVKSQGTMRITNPNLFLLSQAGVINPLLIAWERVPFSFMVDWVVNVGDCLSAITDTLGATYSGSVTTRRSAWVHSRYQRDSSGLVTGGYSSGAFKQNRYLWSGAPTTTLKINFGVPSWQRILTGVSLGFQNFSK